MKKKLKAKFLNNESHYCFGDNQKAKEKLKWLPKIRFEEGIKKVIKDDPRF